MLSQENINKLCMTGLYRHEPDVKYRGSIYENQLFHCCNWVFEVKYNEYEDTYQMVDNFWGDGSVKNNIDALETIVNYAMDKDVPYFAINVPNDMCTNCGYTDDIADECPMCGCKEIRRLRRVTGYLTGDYKSAFNKGKQQEVEMRVSHKTFK